MIISHRHRYIFVHIPKAAGTSVTVYLSRSLGPWDIQLGSYGEAATRGIGPNLRARFYAFGRQSPVKVAKTLIRGGGLTDLVNGGMRGRFGGQLWDHSSAAEVARFDPKAWKGYFKFCVTRNPYERVVSIYHWHYRKQRDVQPSFSEMLRRMEENAPDAPRMRWNSWKMYTEDDRVTVDLVARQETLASDMKVVCERVGIPFDASLLTHEKSQGSTRDYGAIYRPGDRERVARIFAPEIERFSYQFPQ